MNFLLLFLLANLTFTCPAWSAGGCYRVGLAVLDGCCRLGEEGGLDSEKTFACLRVKKLSVQMKPSECEQLVELFARSLKTDLAIGGENGLYIDSGGKEVIAATLRQIRREGVREFNSCMKSTRLQVAVDANMFEFLEGASREEIIEAVRRSSFSAKSSSPRTSLVRSVSTWRADREFLEAVVEKRPAEFCQIDTQQLADKSLKTSLLSIITKRHTIEAKPLLFYSPFAYCDSTPAWKDPDFRKLLRKWYPADVKEL